ncbi:MAG: hypothetical protein HZB16_17970 [Armatimonadetes bacterium]|nr:hypothetical protein [Armatimonadota bacterium]
MSDRWRLEGEGIAWQPADGGSLPHADHVEMSGRQVSLIAYWGLDRDRRLSLRRRIYWPTLRGRKDDVRGYLRRELAESCEPVVLIDGIERRSVTERVSELRFDGVLAIEHEPSDGVRLTRELFPDPAAAAVIERWTLTNVSAAPLVVEVGALSWRQGTGGYRGAYRVEVDQPGAAATLAPGASLVTSTVIAARRATAKRITLDGDAALASRRERITALSAAMRLETPDPVLNRCFQLACLRTGEALFETKLGLVHSPCGNSYYGGVWANDQVEYFGPFAPLLGDDDANLAALNAYRVFAKWMKPSFAPIPSSFEVEGDAVWTHCGDRGDAAMYLYGASRYLLARGDASLAAQLWPALAWCAEYCQRQLTPDGVVASDTDELEGRFPTGRANLSTSTLAYGGLRSAAAVARGLDKPDQAADFDQRAEALSVAIESYFGATVEGFSTYRYFDGGEVLRSWICLPLTMGLNYRAAGTIEALFSPRLWTEDGLATQAGEVTFWDRATLYGLRGVLMAGATERAVAFLTQFSRRRLLGDHVPYMVEAYPEGGQAHLAAESALYARVVTEGLFGLTPTGFDRFTCRPRLPAGWPSMALRGVCLGGKRVDLEVDADRLRVTIDGREQAFRPNSGSPVEVVLC